MTLTPLGRFLRDFALGTVALAGLCALVALGCALGALVGGGS